MIRLADLEIDEANFSATVGGRPLRISAQSFDLLRCLAFGAGRVVTKEELNSRLWPHQVVSEWALHAAIRKLRAALEEAAVEGSLMIETVRGRGYRLTEQPKATPTRPSLAPVAEALRLHRDEGVGFMVDREAEMTRLSRALDDALAGQPRTVFVAGAAGIGKSCVVARFAELARLRGCAVLRGYCNEGEDPALWPWAQMVRAFCAMHEAEEVRTILRPVASELVRALPAVRSFCTDAVPAEQSDPELARLGLLDGFVELFIRIAEARPTALIVEDLHWADALSLKLLRALARQGRGRMVLVATYRNDEIDRIDPVLSLASGLGKTTAETLVLKGLSDSESRRLLTGLGANPADGALLDKICKVAGGSPFLLEQFYRHYAEQPERRQGELLRAPEQVERLIVRRLAARSESCRRVLELAAVLGQEFSVVELGGASGTNAAQLADVLDEAVRYQMIEKMSGPAEGWYRFGHALQRATVYGAIPSGRKAQLHLAVAEAIESRHAGSVPAGEAQRLAHHFARAIAVAGAYRAFRYSVIAGEEADRQLAFEEAAAHFSRAVELFDLAADSPESDIGRTPTERDPVLCELLLSLSRAAQKMGDIETSTRAWEQALPIARRLEHPSCFARCVAAASFLLWEDARLTSLHAEALARLGPEPSEERVLVLAGLAQRLMDAPGPRERRDTMMREALGLAPRATGRTAQKYVLDAAIQTLEGGDVAEERLRCADTLLAMGNDDGDAWAVAQAYRGRCLALLQLGRVSDAVREWKQLRAFSATTRSLPVQLYVDSIGSALALIDARLDEAEERVERERELAERLANLTAKAVCVAHSLCLWREQGRLDRAFAEFKQFGAGLPRMQWPPALVRGELGDCGRFEHDLSRWVARRSGPFRHGHEGIRLMGLFWVGLVCAKCQAADLAAVLQRELKSTPDAWPVAGMYTFGSMRHVLGVLAYTRGRWKQAVTYLERALEAHSQPGATLLRLWTQFELYHALSRRGLKEDRERILRLRKDVYDGASRFHLVELSNRIENDRI